MSGCGAVAAGAGAASRLEGPPAAHSHDRRLAADGGWAHRRIDASAVGPRADFRKFCWIYGALRRNRFPEMSMEICCSREAGRGLSPRCILAQVQISGNSVGNMCPEGPEEKAAAKMICGNRPPGSIQLKSTTAENQSLRQNLTQAPISIHPGHFSSMCLSAVRHSATCVSWKFPGYMLPFYWK